MLLEGSKSCPWPKLRRLDVTRTCDPSPPSAVVRLRCLAGGNPVIRLAAFVHRVFFVSRSRLLAENVALRLQLAVLTRVPKRPKLRNRDRTLWIVLSRFFADWRSWLVIVKPETVVAWHRAGFRLYWRRKSRSKKSGRPRITSEIAGLIRQMAQENSLWGAPRIHGELKKLGFDVAERTVGRYLRRIGRKRPSGQSWMTLHRAAPFQSGLQWLRWVLLSSTVARPRSSNRVSHHVPHRQPSGSH